MSDPAADSVNFVVSSLVNSVLTFLRYWSHVHLIAAWCPRGPWELAVLPCVRGGGPVATASASFLTFVGTLPPPRCFSSSSLDLKGEPSRKIPDFLSNVETPYFLSDFSHFGDL